MAECSKPPSLFQPPRRSMMVNMLKERLPGLSIWTMSFLAMATKVLLESESSSLAGFIGLFLTFGAIAIVIATHWENVQKFARPLYLPAAALLTMFIFASGTPLAQIVQWGPFTIALYLLITLYCLPTFFDLSREVLLQVLENHLHFGNYPPAPELGNDHIQNDTIKGITLQGSQISKPGTLSIMAHHFEEMGRPASTYSSHASDISLGEIAELAARKARAKSVSSILRLPRKSRLFLDYGFHPKDTAVEYPYAGGLPETVASQDPSRTASDPEDIYCFNNQASDPRGGAD